MLQKSNKRITKLYRNGIITSLSNKEGNIIYKVNKLQYDWNGGMDGPSNEYFPSNSSANVSDIIPVKLGCTFDHWKDSSLNIYHAGDIVYPPIELKAIYTTAPIVGSFTYGTQKRFDALINSNDSITYALAKNRYSAIADFEGILRIQNDQTSLDFNVSLDDSGNPLFTHTYHNEQNETITVIGKLEILMGSSNWGIIFSTTIQDNNNVTQIIRSSETFDSITITT